MAGVFTGSLGGGEWGYLEEAANLFWSSSSGPTGLKLAFEDYLGTEDDDTVVFGFELLYRNPYQALIDLRGGNDAVEFLGQSSMNQIDLGDGERNVFKANESLSITDIYGGTGEDLLLFKSPGWGNPNITRSTIKSYDGDDLVILEKNPEVQEACLLGVNFELGNGDDAFLVRSSGKTFGSWDSEDLTTIYLGNGDDIFVLEQIEGSTQPITTARHSEESYVGADFLIDGGEGDDIIDISMLSIESLGGHTVVIGGEGDDQIFLPVGSSVSRFIENGFERISVGGEVVYNVMPEPEPEPEPEPYDGIIESVRGKGKLKGTNVADAFTFDSFEGFTKIAADKIIGFDASEGDKIVVSPDAFPALQGVSDISFASTRSKKEFKQFSKEDYNFVYFEKRGRLYFDGNGAEKNWGNSDEGGLVAILKGKPELTVEDITLLA